MSVTESVGGEGKPAKPSGTTWGDLIKACTTPVRNGVWAIVEPWWEKKIEAKAESLAVRRKVVEALIRFRISDFARFRDLDADKAEGLAVKVIALIRPTILADAAFDATSTESLSSIELEILINAVPMVSWIQLACLYQMGEFNHKRYISCYYNDGNSVHSGSNVIVKIQDSFPFFRRMIELSRAGEQRSSLSVQVGKALRIYTSRNELPEVLYAITDSPATWGTPLTMYDMKIANGWKP